jgi:hypothetical protein
MFDAGGDIIILCFRLDSVNNELYYIVHAYSPIMALID